MRSEKKKFAWIGRLRALTGTAYGPATGPFSAAIPVAGTACVIDRPGYVARGYGTREGNSKWLLCRSAFDIVVERAAKLAKQQGRRLKVFYEMADPATNASIEGYFYNVKSNGMGFDAANSAKYLPLTAAEFQYVLLDIEGKGKPNRILQIADTYVYAIARGSYDRKFGIYRRLAESGRLVTDQVASERAFDSGGKNLLF